jgi:tetratricopeptide (TPR) repeat protein
MAAEPARPPAPPRRGRRLLALLGFASLVGGAAAWYFRPPAGAEPPALDLAGLDPDVTAALTAAREAVRREPRSADAWGRLGMLLDRQQFTAEAPVCYAEAERLAPRDRRWPYFQGLIHSSRDPAAAVPELERALARGAGPAARVRLGEALMALGRDAEAGEQFAAALGEDPDGGRAHLGLARLAFARGDRAGGEAHVRAASAAPSSRKAAQTLLAEALGRLGDAGAERVQAEAARLPDDKPLPDPDLEAAIEFADQAAHSRFKAAQDLIAERRYAEAVPILREVVAERPGSLSEGLCLTQSLLLVRDYPAAESAAREVLRGTADSPLAHFYLGLALMGRGRAADAAAGFRRATELKPDYAEAYNNLAMALKQSGDRTGAVAAYRQAVLCQPQRAKYHAALGELLAETGQAAEARDHLRQAVQLDPTDGRARRLLADAEKQPGGGRR